MRSRFFFLIVLTVAATTGCPGNELPQWGPSFDAADTGWLLSVWASSAESTYAVGGVPDAGVVMQRDQSGWRALELPSELGDVPLLRGVYGPSEGDIFFVGNEGLCLRLQNESWSEIQTGTTQNLRSVWGTSTTDIWAVGGNGEAGDATILHFDGTSFSPVDLPPARLDVQSIFDVWGTAADNVWFVGERGTLLHWNGTVLSDAMLETTEDLMGIGGSGPNHVVAVGGRSNAVLAVFDGTLWRTQSLASLPGLNGVWTRHPDLAHVVGSDGTLAVIDTVDFTYQDHYQGTALSYADIVADSEGTAYAVGGNLLQTDGPYQGIASQRTLTLDE